MNVYDLFIEPFTFNELQNIWLKCTFSESHYYRQFKRQKNVTNLSNSLVVNYQLGRSHRKRSCMTDVSRQWIINHSLLTHLKLRELPHLDKIEKENNLKVH